MARYIDLDKVNKHKEDYTLKEVYEICKKQGVDCYSCPFSYVDDDELLCALDCEPYNWTTNIFDT